MKQYIHLLETFIDFAGYTYSHLKAGDTDLVHLEQNDELLVIFSPYGSEDIFIIFEDEKAVMTFGQWAEEIYGNSLEDFEHLLDILKGVLEGEYVVYSMQTENGEIAMLMNVSTSQVVSVFVQEGKEYLEKVSAADFFEKLAGHVVTFEQNAWNDEDPELSDDYSEIEQWHDEDDFHHNITCHHDADRLENENECNDPDCLCHHHHHHMDPHEN